MVEQKKAASLTSMAKAKLGDGMVSRRDGAMVSPSMLRINPEINIRGIGLSSEEYWEQPHIKQYVDDLAHSYSIGSHVPPIIVKFNIEEQLPYVIDGHHRFRGLMKAIENGAQIEKVPVEELRGDELAQDMLMLTSGNSLELTAVDKALVIARMYAHGLDEKQIADKIRKSITYVNDMLMVNDLPLAVKRQIQLKQISYAKALANLRGEAPKKAKSITPPKKVVREFMDILADFRTAPVNEEGNVEVCIPAELLKKFLENHEDKNGQTNNSENQETLKFDEE